MNKELDLLAIDIANSGVEYVFGIPGSGVSYYLLDQLEKKGVQFILVHHEASAALMAGGYAKTSGNIGISLSIKGPGLTNMIPGVAACRYENLPVISISECYGKQSPTSQAHKKIDQDDVLRAYVKTRESLVGNEDLLSKCILVAKTEPPGPVHIELADIDTNLFEGENSKPAGCIDEVVEAISRAKQPVLIVGSLATRKVWGNSINELAIPVFSTACAKGIFDETNKYSAGVYTGVGGEKSPEYGLLTQTDLIVSIGLRHSEVLKTQQFKCKSIQLDEVEEKYINGFNFDYLIDSNSYNYNKVIAALKNKNWGEELIAQRQEIVNAYFDTSYFLPASVYSFIESYFKGYARIVLDTGDFCTVGEHVCNVREHHLYLSSGQGRYMGISLPLAIGASLADRSVPTVCYTGDGGIGMYIAELKVAKAMKLPLVVVLLTDGGFSSVKRVTDSNRFTSKGVIPADSSWYGIVNGMGIDSQPVNCLRELGCMLEKWDKEGPIFIEASFDEEAYSLMALEIR
ncbi:thiamine pyrophosphate-binding protein [Litoribacillus peritrichatus]|uniref:Biosynthetic-type acetolactate synthase large subunit n=1 Tax=Litoribacillus peritrichatus TaxID=718191 RepID=A0ABP7MIG9_9GAMM